MPGAFVPRRLRRVSLSLVVLAIVLAWSTPAAANRADLAKARTLYNQRQLDEAIEFATSARATPATADAAAIVEARARLERYRERADPADLSAARSALSTVRATALEPRDRIEFLLAAGESLFLEDDFGAAAEIFGIGLQNTDDDVLLRHSLLEWWGSAVERQAGLLPREGRIAAFVRLGARMNEELARDPTAAAASYWSVVALRGAGDSLRAWDAAVAGWVRARLMGDRAAMLRADLDRLVLDGIIPDRARQLPADQREAAMAQYKADWELVKEKWK